MSECRRGEQAAFFALPMGQEPRHTPDPDHTTLQGGYSMDFTFEIVEHIGVLSQTNNGWKKELNLVSWNGREPVYSCME